MPGSAGTFLNWFGRPDDPFDDAITHLPASPTVYATLLQELIGVEAKASLGKPFVPVPFL